MPTNEELAVKIQQGDQDAQVILWKQVERLIDRLAGSFVAIYGNKATGNHESSVMGNTFDDLKQECYLAMMKAVNDFDIDKGFKFTTYLSKRIQTAFADACGYRGNTAERPLNVAVSINTPLSDEDDGAELGDILPTDESYGDIDTLEYQILYEELQTALQGIIATLPEDEQRVIQNYFYDGMTYQAIADKMQIKPAKVRRLRNSAISTMRKEKNRKRLEEINAALDARTNFYLTGGSLFFVTGNRIVESNVIQREHMRKIYNH